jgi:hypothetical protein
MIASTVFCNIATLLTSDNGSYNIDEMLQDNISLVRLILMLSRAGNKGLSTLERLDKPRSTNHGQKND